MLLRRWAFHLLTASLMSCDWLTGNFRPPWLALHYIQMTAKLLVSCSWQREDNSRAWKPEEADVSTLISIDRLPPFLVSSHPPLTLILLFCSCPLSFHLLRPSLSFFLSAFPPSLLFFSPTLPQFSFLCLPFSFSIFLSPFPSLSPPLSLSLSLSFLLWEICVSGVWGATNVMNQFSLYLSAVHVSVNRYLQGLFHSTRPPIQIFIGQTSIFHLIIGPLSYLIVERISAQQSAL